MYVVISVMLLAGCFFLAGCAMVWFTLIWELISKWREQTAWENGRKLLAIVMLLAFSLGVGVSVVDSTVSLLNEGGRASIGKVEGNRHFLRRGRKFIEVSQATWTLKRRLEILNDYAFPASAVGAFGLVILINIARAKRRRQEATEGEGRGTGDGEQGSEGEVSGQSFISH